MLVLSFNILDENIKILAFPLKRKYCFKLVTNEGAIMSLDVYIKLLFQ